MKKNGGLTGLLGLLVFALLAVCLLGTLLAGATGYKRMVAGGDAQFADSTAQRYLAVRVRQAEQVTVEAFGGTTALALWETIEGFDFVTRVYEKDGCLWELFSLAETELDPEDGEKLMEVESLEMDWEGALLHLRVNGNSIYLLPRQGKQVGL